MPAGSAMGRRSSFTRNGGFIFKCDMIYLHNIKRLQWVYIPVNGDVPDGALTLFLHGNVNLKDTEVSVISTRRGRQYFRCYWRFADKMEKGEYYYELRVDGKPIAEGLAQIGEYEAQRRQYNKTIEYKQYGAKQ